MRRKSIPSKVISLFLLTAMLFSALCANAYAAEKLMFTGQFFSDTDIDLSGIKLDIYRSTPTYTDNNIEKYQNNYAFSVYTDEDGTFSFERPYGMIIIRADMSTLPSKTGITEYMWTFTDSNERSLTASVNRIKYIKIDSTNAESGNVKVDISSADKTPLYCNFTVDISDAEVSEASKDKSGKRTYRTERKITVRANGTKKTKLLIGEYTETAVPVVSLKKPEYDDPCEYTEDGGFFSVHYDENQYSSSTARNVYETFSKAKAFYDSYGFNEPLREKGSKKYNIYLITSGGAAATTKHVKNGRSYIVMQTPLDYCEEKYEYQTSAIAHELFHAIMYTYTRAYGVSPPKWFRESFANWAGNEYIGSSTSTLKKYVNIFQSNPELSLTNTFDLRIYGSMLFPLTLSESYGGMQTIRTIFEQFKELDPNTPNIEMEAISAGLGKVSRSYSRTGAFVKFALNNMYPSRYYCLKDSDKWNDAARSADDTFDSRGFRSLEFQPLSAKYYDVIPKLSTDSIYITVADNNDRYSGVAFCCVVNKKYGGFTDYSGMEYDFTTYRIKNASKLRASSISFGVINTSTIRTQDIDIRVTYK